MVVLRLVSKRRAKDGREPGTGGGIDCGAQGYTRGGVQGVGFKGSMDWYIVVIECGM